MDAATIVWTIIIFIFISITTIFIWLEMKYKHKVIIFELTKGKSFIIVDKAKELLKKDKTMWWKLKKERDKIRKYMPIPPSETVYITKKGKKIVFCYRTDSGEYIFIKDKAQIKEIPQELRKKIEEMPPDISYISDGSERVNKMREREYKLINEWRKDNNIIEPLQPVTKEDRIAYLQILKDAELKRTVDWKKDLPLYMAIGGGVIVIALLLIFGPDMLTTYTKGATMISDSQVFYEKLRHEDRMQEIQEMNNVTRTLRLIHNLEIENQRRLDELEQNKDNG